MRLPVSSEEGASNHAEGAIGMRLKVTGSIPVRASCDSTVYCKAHRYRGMGRFDSFTVGAGFRANDTETQ